MAQPQIILKPQRPIINWGNPITKGLVFDVSFWEGVGKFIEDGATPLEEILGSFTNSPKWVKTYYGYAINPSTNGGSGAVTFSTLNSRQSNLTRFTYEAILNITSGAVQYQRPIHVGNQDYPNNRWDLELDNSWGWVFKSPRSGGTDMAYSISVPSRGVYHHIVISMDFSSNSNIPIWYVDNVSQSITTRSSGTLTPASDGGVLQIGNNSVNFNQGWGGNILYTRFWNRILTPTEIGLLYTNPWRIYRKNDIFYQRINSITAAVSSRKQYLLLLGVG